MIFHSLTYFISLPILFLLYNFVPAEWQWLLLLTASIMFYLQLGVPYIVGVLAVVTAVTYGTGIALHQARGIRMRRMIFWGAVATNVLVLGYMKYMPFIAENANHILGTTWTLQKSLVSIGVSYFVFQAISYLANIYFEIDQPERHPGYFALYMAFFPKLLQGPIERPGDLLPQLKKRYQFDYDNVRSGLLLFAWGLLKKAVVADRVAPYVDLVYGHVGAYSGIPLIVATYLYAIQIFCDFSGYTDMALGSARMFNITLTQNFNYPYLATSVADFWRRWHISFSSWILDYIFKPLHFQWRNSKNIGTAGAILIAFLVSGIWHGAAWTFIVWGALHGIFLSSAVLYKPYQKRISARLGMAGTRFTRYWQIFVTFNLVSFSWIFFRANSLHDAGYILKNLFRGIPVQLPALFSRSGFKELICFGQATHDLIVAMVAITLLICLSHEGKRLPLIKRSTPVRWLAYYATLAAVAFYGVFDTTARFIYFQF